ncbi:MAG: protoporphyrinogen oxidase [Deltaproteobacteria bacterium]|nr:protoporphyrinogen oxidase [Deltaproteobacteria bacterium]
MRRVVVVGGGISGLSTAFFLQERIRERRAPIEVFLIEKEAHPGGSILTERMGDFILEGGPDCFLSEKPWALRLCERLGMEDELLNTSENRRTFILWRGRLHALPEGFMLLVPTSFMPFVMSSLVSPFGKIRMAMDLFIPARKSDGEESLADFVSRRLGREALEKIAEPLVAGIHASVPETMSLKATFPRFLELEQEYGSLIRGMLVRRKKFARYVKNRKGPERTMFVTLKKGMGDLVEAILARLNSGSVLLGKEVAALGRRGPEGSPHYFIETEGGEKFEAEALVLATPAFVSGRLLGTLDRPLADILQTIPYVSSAIVHLAYRRSQISHPLDGFGFVVPRREKRSIMASTWTSVKFAHRVPDGHVLLRVFVGGAKNRTALGLDDHEMVAMCREELRQIMGIEAEPLFTRVYRWERSMPQYTLGHLERVARIQELISRHPGIFLTGCAYRGVGISDCIHEGEQAAERILDYLGDRQRGSETNLPASRGNMERHL